MGKKGAKSKRGVGEIDKVVRNKRICIWVTEEDWDLLKNAVIATQQSRTEILIQLIRENL